MATTSNVVVGLDTTSKSLSKIKDAIDAYIGIGDKPASSSVRGKFDKVKVTTDQINAAIKGSHSADTYKILLDRIVAEMNSYLTFANKFKSYVDSLANVYEGIDTNNTTYSSVNVGNDTQA